MKKIAALSGNDMSVYAREGDALDIGGARLESIEYLAWRGRFYGVNARTFFFSDWETLKQACFEKFGKGVKPKLYFDEYIWNGDVTNIRLVYTRDAEGGMLTMYSTAISREREKAGRDRTPQQAPTRQKTIQGF